MPTESALVPAMSAGWLKLVVFGPTTLWEQEMAGPNWIGIAVETVFLLVLHVRAQQ